MLAVAGLIAAVGAGSAAAYTVVQQPGAHASALGDPAPKTTPGPPEPWYEKPEPGPVSFTLVAGGDILTHGSVNQSARTGSSYDYGKLWKEMDAWTAGADLALCHLEVPVAPKGTAITGYPTFGAPAKLVDDIAAAGWDGCSLASNHSVDKGWNGVVATLDAFEKARLGATGTARSKAERDAVQWYYVVEGVRRIKVAHISYTYGLNGLPKPEGKPWAANTYNAGSANVSGVLKDAKAAREEGADVVVVSLHCCVEYVTQPGSAQRKAAEKLAESGLVDLLIGHHAHVPQPVEKLKGGPHGDGMWAAFGLGNYISNQGTNCCVADTSNGLLLTATFTVGLDGTVAVEAEWTAITVDRGRSHSMYVLSGLKGGKGSLSSSEVRDRYSRASKAAGKDAEERTEPPEKLADAAYPIPRGVYAP